MGRPEGALVDGLQLEGGVVGEDLVVLQRQQSELQRFVLDKRVSEERERDLWTCQWRDGAREREGGGDLSGGAVEEAGVQGEMQIAEGDVHDVFIATVIGSLVPIEGQVSIPQHSVEVDVPIALRSGR
jgi:hypothetical protein